MVGLPYHIVIVMAKYLPRTLESVLKRAVKEFQVVVLTGPRQSGKTTLLRHLFPSYAYTVLDDPLWREVVASDPELFFETHRPPLILDEIQAVPTLLPFIKQRVDAHRNRPGQFLLTGSQQFPLMR